MSVGILKGEPQAPLNAGNLPNATLVKLRFSYSQRRAGYGIQR